MTSSRGSFEARPPRPPAVDRAGTRRHGRPSSRTGPASNTRLQIAGSPVAHEHAGFLCGLNTRKSMVVARRRTVSLGALYAPMFGHAGVGSPVAASLRTRSCRCRCRASDTAGSALHEALVLQAEHGLRCSVARLMTSPISRTSARARCPAEMAPELVGCTSRPSSPDARPWSCRGSVEQLRHLFGASGFCASSR